MCCFGLLCENGYFSGVVCVPVILCCNFFMVNSIFMCYLILPGCGCVLEVFVLYDNVGLYIFAALIKYSICSNERH